MNPIRTIIGVLSMIPVMLFTVIRMGGFALGIALAIATFVVLAFAWVNGHWKRRWKKLRYITFEVSEGFPVINFSRKPFLGKRKRFRVRLANVSFAHEKSSLYPKGMKMLRDMLGKAKRIEVDFILSEAYDGCVHGHVYLDDVYLNLACIKDGLMEVDREHVKRVPFRLRRAWQSAERRKVGVYSNDPDKSRLKLIYAQCAQRSMSRGGEKQWVAPAERIA